MSNLNSPKAPFVVGAVLSLLVALPSLALAQVRLLPAPREAHFAGETAL
jgi:hypothetical protein